MLRAVRSLTMESRLVDPHNHVPEVSPEDVWGDSDTLSPHFPTTATVLPPKRSQSESTAKSSGTKLEEGLRIESPYRHSAPETPESTPRLEVTEIDGSVMRLQPEEPAASKVPRQFTFHERPVHEKKTNHGEGRDWGIASKQSVRWLLGSGLAVTGIIVACMLLLPSVNKSNAKSTRDTITAVPAEEPVPPLDLLLPLQADAEQLFRVYARSAVADDFIPYLRDSKQVEHLVRAKPVIPKVSKDWVPGPNTEWRVIDGKDIGYGILEGKLPDFTPFRAYTVLSGNHLLLDWKATSAYGTATFRELEKQQGDPGEIRGFMLPSRFYTHVFPEQEYLSYQLLSPDREIAIWVYAKRNSPAGAGIADLFKTGDIIQSAPDEAAVTLRLAHPPEGGQPNQWLVAEFLHGDWILP